MWQGWDADEERCIREVNKSPASPKIKGNTAQCTLFKVNIYLKINYTQANHYLPPPFYHPHLLLMFGQKQTGLEPMQRENPDSHTEGQYILSCPQCFWFLSQQYKVCHGVLCCSTHWSQTWLVWPFLYFSFSVSLCFAAAVPLAPRRLFRLDRLEVAVYVSHRLFMNDVLFICVCLTFFSSNLLLKLQLQKTMMWSPSLRGCGRKWTH